jgi:hypothetical protein
MWQNAAVAVSPKRMDARKRTRNDTWSLNRMSAHGYTSEYWSKPKSNCHIFGSPEPNFS